MPVFTEGPENGVEFSDALVEAATHAPIGKVVILTYEFTHSSFTTRALVAISHTDVAATTEDDDDVTFVAIGGLRSDGPEESAKGGVVQRMSLDGVSQEIVDRLDAALLSLEPVGIIERVYMSDDLTGPALLPPAKGVVRTGKVTERTVEIEIGIGDPSNQPFPRKNYVREQYPGLST